MSPHPNFEFDIFLSYSSTDRTRVIRLAERLKDEGVKVWLDKWAIKPGDNILLSIEHGMEMSRTLLLCLSPAALGSDWIKLERSSTIFRDPANIGRSFIPLLLENCALPATIGCYKYIDFRNETESDFAELLTIFRPEIPSPSFKQTKANKIIQSREPLAQLRFKLTGHNGKVNSVTFSPDGKFLVSGSRDETVKIWNVETGRCQATLMGHNGEVSCISIASDGMKIFSCSSDSTVRVWEIKSERIFRVLEGHKTGVNGVIPLNDDGTRALSCSSHIFDSLKVWDVDSSLCLMTLVGHKGNVTAAVTRKNGTEALSSSYDRTLKLWNITSGECIATLHGHDGAIRSVQIASNGRYAISGGDDKTVKLWDLEARSCIRTMKGHSQKVYSVAISPDGTLIASAGFNDHTTRLWDGSSGRCLQVIKHEESPSPMSVTFSLDGCYLAVGASKTNAIYLYNLSNNNFITDSDPGTAYVK